MSVYAWHGIYPNNAALVIAVLLRLPFLFTSQAPTNPYDDPDLTHMPPYFFHFHTSLVFAWSRRTDDGQTLVAWQYDKRQHTSPTGGLVEFSSVQSGVYSNQYIHRQPNNTPVVRQHKKFLDFLKDISLSLLKAKFLNWPDSSLLPRKYNSQAALLWNSVWCVSLTNSLLFTAESFIWYSIQNATVTVIIGLTTQKHVFSTFLFSLSRHFYLSS